MTPQEQAERKLGLAVSAYRRALLVRTIDANGRVSPTKEELRQVEQRVLTAALEWEKLQ
jgi:hypothetical protein